MAKKRRYRPVHEAYLTEWLGLKFPPGTWRTSVKLGDMLIRPEASTLTPSERRLLLPFAAEADAIVLYKKTLWIIEAMVRHEPGAGEDLLKYKALVPYTSSLQPYKDWPIKLVILTPLELGWYEQFYRSLGIQVEYYAPPWIIEYITSYPRRFWRGKLSRLGGAT